MFHSEELGQLRFKDSPHFRPGRVGNGGYRLISILSTAAAWPEHRLIWKVVTGRDPVGVIDHINGIRDDNRFVNLRDVPPEVNATNVVRGRWRNTLATRKQAERAAKAAAKEARERAMLAKLKAKYEVTT